MYVETLTTLQQTGPQLGITFDSVFHISDLLIIAGVSWKVLRVANRLMDVMKYFPPHRHSNGTIEYPPGFAPGRSEKLNVGKA